MSGQSSTIKSASIDNDEMKLFENFKSFWWNPNGRLKSLHQMNDMRIPFVVNCLKGIGQLKSKYANSLKALTNIKIADVGCGGGLCTESLAKLGADIIGIEPCTELLKLAKRHAQENEDITNEIKYVNLTVEDISQEEQYKNYFDVVLLYDVAEHVADLESLIKSSIEILRPGGSLFYSTFNRTPVAWAYCIIFWQEITDLAPKGSHDLDKFVTPEESVALLEKYNCEILVNQGTILYANKWFWSKNNSLHYYIHAVKKQ